MPYTPQVWNDDDANTPLNATRLAVLENGVAAAALTTTQAMAVSATISNGSAPVVLVDTTAAPVTATLPAAPTTGSLYLFIDKTAKWATNNFIVARNGKLIDGAAANVTYSTASRSVWYYYDGTSWHTLGKLTVADIAAAPASGIAAAAITGVAVTKADTGTVTSTMLTDDTIVDADINSAAAIAKTKVAGTAITAADTGTVTSTMILNGTILNADVNASAAIAYSKLALTGAILNADLAGSIAESKITSNGRLEMLYVAGGLSAGAGVQRMYFPKDATILGVSLAVNTAPTGAALVVDVNKNGTTIFTTQGNRPSISISGFAAAEGTAPDVTAFAAGDYLTVDIDVVGSTIAGSNLTVMVRWTWA